MNLLRQHPLCSKGLGFFVYSISGPIYTVIGALVIYAIIYSSNSLSLILGKCDVVGTPSRNPKSTSDSDQSGLHFGAILLDIGKSPCAKLRLPTLTAHDDQMKSLNASGNGFHRIESRIRSPRIPPCCAVSGGVGFARSSNFRTRAIFPLIFLAKSRCWCLRFG